MINQLKLFLLFFILGLLVYSNGLNNKFLIDDYAFLHNPVWSSTKYIPTQWNPYREQALGVIDAHEMQSYYRPTAHILYDFCYGVFKNNFWMYHLLNLVLFVFAVFLIYLFIGKISGNYQLAFLASLFYLVHPINGIVVNYISASVFSFQVIFTLGTILFLFKSLEKENNRLFYFLSLGCSFLALFWNESGVMTLFYISAVILIFRNDPFKKKAVYLLPYFLIIFFYMISRTYFLSFNDIMFKQMAAYHMNIYEFLANMFKIYTWYIGQLFCPQGVVMVWATPGLHQDLGWYDLGTVLLILISLCLLVRFAKNKIGLMAVIWLLIGFVPVGLAAFRIPRDGVTIEPHWFIVSSIGFFILAAYFCLYLLDRSKKIALVLVFILIFVWAAASHAYNRIWEDQKTYALFWAKEVPSLRSTYFYIADAYQREHAYKLARGYYKLAFAHDPSDLEIYNNLGVMDEQDGDLKGAELNYSQVFKIYPFSAPTYDNLATIYYKEGRLKKAEEYFNRALMLNPLLIEPRRALASMYIKNAEYQKAFVLCLKNLEIVNDDPKTLYLLVEIYLHDKDITNLNKYAKLAINAETDPQALTRLGVLLSQNNITSLALDCFEKAILLAPDYKEAYLNAGVFLSSLKQYDVALQILKLGAVIDPDDQRFKQDISEVMALKLK